MNMNKKFTVPRWDDLPDVDLYLEQVISLIDGSIGEFINEDGKKVITKTMVNNYVKQKTIAPPVNKKYDKLSVASLFVIAILKSVYSIQEISKLIELALEANVSKISYDQFCNVIEEAVDCVFSGKSLDERGELNEAQYILRNVGRTFACKLYVKEKFLKAYDVSDMG